MIVKNKEHYNNYKKNQGVLIPRQKVVYINLSIVSNRLPPSCIKIGSVSLMLRWNTR
jgi:hypothetical protein